MDSSVILFEDLIKSSTFNELLGEEALSTLRCPVCMDYFNEPVILVCGHTFCYGCLHDMSMHTKSRMMNVHIRNIRIHCPNCRVPVHVQGILRKHCTTNFTVASFLESIKEVKVPIKAFADASTNTETKEEAKDDESDYGYDEELLNKMNDELDNAISAFRGEADVIRDAWREIHKLREEYGRDADLSFGENKLVKNEVADDGEKECGFAGHLKQLQLLDDSLQREDPAIVMSSISIRQTDC